MHPRFECFHNGNYQMFIGTFDVFDMSKVYNYS